MGVTNPERLREIDLSIVIVNWNGRAYLANCLASIYSRVSAVSLEVIVVDNASRDHSLDGVTEAFPAVRLIVNDSNVGFARANNQAMRMSHGRYVLLLNPDTVVLGDCLDAMVQLMDSHRDVGAGSCQLLNPDGTIQRSCRTFPSLWTVLWDACLLDGLFPRNSVIGRYHLQGWSHDDEREVDQPAGAFLMVRREVLDTVGLLDERFFVYYEDVDWCYRIKMAGWRIMFWPHPKTMHVGGGLTHSRYTEAVNLIHESMKKYFLKNHGPTAARLAGVIHLAGVGPHLAYWALRCLVSSGERAPMRRMMTAHWRLLANEIGLAR